MNTISINPYTTELITIDALFRFQKQKTELIEKNAWIEIEDLDYEFTEEDKIEQEMIRVFHKYDMLDNYTNHLWFKDLSMHQLKRLYKECVDIWSYRACLTNDDRQRIVEDGIAFIYSITRIVNMKNTAKNKIKLQKILLGEFERFAEEGINVAERKIRHTPNVMWYGYCILSSSKCLPRPTMGSITRVKKPVRF